MVIWISVIGLKSIIVIEKANILIVMVCSKWLLLDLPFFLQIGLIICRLNLGTVKEKTKRIVIFGLLTWLLLRNDTALSLFKFTIFINEYLTGFILTIFIKVFTKVRLWYKFAFNDLATLFAF